MVVRPTVIALVTQVVGYPSNLRRELRTHFAGRLSNTRTLLASAGCCTVKRLATGNSLTAYASAACPVHLVIYVLFMMLLFGALAMAMSLVDVVLDMFTAFLVKSALLATPLNVWLVKRLATVSTMTHGTLVRIEGVLL